MIDYFAHVAVFERVRAALAAVNDAGLTGARDELLADAAAYPEAARLGTFVDHLLMHASSTAAEIEILGRAADLWGQGIAVYESVGSVRAAIEGAFADPAAPGAAAGFNAAMATFVGLRPQLAAIQAGLDAIGADVTLWRHLPDPHPRQRDLPVAQWGWGDRFLARRTEAFVRAAFKHAKGPRTRAFAMGALASYAGNVAGSAYLGHVTGGPRRTHPRRDRIARNVVGGWLRANRPLPALQTLHADVAHNGSGGQPGGLQPELAQFLTQALAEAFPGMPPADLSGGLARLEKHLELLAVFVRPAEPVPPPPVLMATMSTLDADGNISFDTPPDPGDPPPGSQPPMGPDPTPGTASVTSDNKSSNGCLVGLLVVTLLYFLIDGIVALAEGKKYDPFGDLANVNTGDEGGDENVTATSQQLQALASSSGGALMLGELFNFQMQVWQALDDGLTILIKKGLVYPDALIIGGSTFSQFTAPGALAAWPFRTEVTTNEGYLLSPTGPVEQPTAAPSPYPAGATPFTFVDAPAGPTPYLTAPGEAVRLWLQIARAVQDSVNFDLDADRGHHAACWQVADGTSIHDDPVMVDVLPYTGV